MTEAAALVRQAAGLTVGLMVSHQVALGGARVAVEQGARRLTYAELDERANRLARLLAARGIGRGDRVALLAENRLEYAEFFLAAARLGAILACQNWRLGPAELQHCIGLVEPRLLVASAQYAGLVATLGLPAPTLGEEYEAALRGSDARPVPDQAEPEDGLLILYTSGTTGLPKGALISHRAEVARCLVGKVDNIYYPDRTGIIWSPLFHQGAADHLLAILMSGGKAIVQEGFDAGRIAEVVAREEIGWLLLMPGTVGRMIEALRGIRVRGVQLTGTMADLVPRHEIAEVTALLDAPYRNTFGSTETGTPPAGAGRIPAGVAPTSLAKTQSSFCRIRLVDEEDKEVPMGTPGEIAFRGPTLFSGYWRAEEANRTEFRNGWFHMGDMMVRNPDGTLDFAGRRKYLIKSGGENIYPAEIETLLLASPRIADAAVVSQPDATWGEVPVAFVVRRDPALAEAEVLALCRGRIASYKLPKAVHFLEEAEVPRSASGKIMRGGLEERLRRAQNAAA